MSITLNDDLEKKVEEIDEIEDDELEEDKSKTQEEEEEKEEEDIDEEEEKTKTTPDPVEDYKNKFSESAREANILLQKNRQLVTAVDEAAKIADPSDDELKAKYPDWGVMSETEKTLARENMVNAKRFSLIHETVESTRKIDQWNEKVDTFLSEGETAKKYPQLAGKEAEFKAYAAKQNHIGIDMEVLINSFAFSNPTVKSKGSLFQRPNGGDKPVKKELTVDDIAHLRQTNPRKWQQLVASGKANISI